jgi:valyl-tRNA synthetase
MPFITEELWRLTARRDSMLVTAPWPDLQAADIADESADREMRWVIALIEEIRSVRAQMGVPVGLKLPLLQLDLDAAGQAAWDRNAALIQRLARIDSLSIVKDLPKGAAAVPVEGGTFALPLAEVIDVAGEQARLEKTLSKLAKDLGGLRGRLGNPKFVQSAPEEVIEETRDLLAQKEDEEARVTQALKRLAELA